MLQGGGEKQQSRAEKQKGGEFNGADEGGSPHFLFSAPHKTQMVPTSFHPRWSQACYYMVLHGTATSARLAAPVGVVYHPQHIPRGNTH